LEQSGSLLFGFCQSSGTTVQHFELGLGMTHADRRGMEQRGTPGMLPSGTAGVIDQ